MLFRFCPICAMGTVWVFVKRIFAFGRDTGYLKFTCTGCERMSSAQPQERWPNIK